MPATPLRGGVTCTSLPAERQEQKRDRGCWLWRKQVWVADTPHPPQLGCNLNSHSWGRTPEREGPTGLEKSLATCQNRVNKGRTTTPSMLRPSGVTAGGGCAAPVWCAQDLGRHRSLSFRRGLWGCERACTRVPSALAAQGSRFPPHGPAPCPTPAGRLSWGRSAAATSLSLPLLRPIAFCFSLSFSGGDGGEGGGRGSSSRAGCNE